MVKRSLLLVAAISVGILAVSNAESHSPTKKSIQFATANYSNLSDLVTSSDLVFVASVKGDDKIPHDNENDLRPLVLLGHSAVIEQAMASRPDAIFSPRITDSILLGQILLDDSDLSEFANGEDLKSEMPSVKDGLINGEKQLIFGVSRLDSAGQKYVEVVASAMSIANGSKFKFGKIFGPLSGSTVGLSAVRQAISTMNQTPSPWKPQ
jgi:hypothetical protein